ncbi:solute carrier family 66 member 3 isoform X2 [Nycticebus coucang]|uniref:solute carrier family 66 member 3 isoform X2 n=1 Tax=Nycticebus coucang TaxID=9470 RepID=UPI00234CBA29|nr:solute carrier family 66 member 3 isoform X2 [Nycticebus coucang]
MEAGLLRFCNWSTLGVCAALKLPQISAVLAAHSARGLSLPSLLLELAGFLVFLRYQCYYGYPPLTYLEYPILIAQDVALLLCIFHFNGNVKQAAPYVAALACSWFVLTLQKWIIDLAMNLCTFISAASKFAQLQCLWKTRDSGAVSALTWSLSAYSCATRIVTTLMTTKDFTILTRFVIMLALNTWVTVTVLRYQKTVKKAE